MKSNSLTGSERAALAANVELTIAESEALLAMSRAGISPGAARAIAQAKARLATRGRVKGSAPAALRAVIPGMTPGAAAMAAFAIQANG